MLARISPPRAAKKELIMTFNIIKIFSAKVL